MSTRNTRAIVLHFSGDGRDRLCRWRTAAAAIVLAAIFGSPASLIAGEEEHGCSAGPGSARTAGYRCAKAGDLLEVVLADLHPTQAVLGFDEVYYKLGRYQAGKDTINKRFDDWCEANGQEKAKSAGPSARLDDPKSFECTVPVGKETPATVDPMKTLVIGGGGRPYLVDGHHTFTSFLESPDGGPGVRVRARVLANLSNLTPAAFWRAMRSSGWVWLRDENDEPISVDQLPHRLGLSRFHNDDFRALVYFTRDVSYTQNSRNANYQEFQWGSWLRREGFDPSAYGDLTVNEDYLAAVEAAATQVSAVLPATAIESGSRFCPPATAAALGRIDFNGGEFAKLSKPYTDPKPGKVAYALCYRNHLRLGQGAEQCK
jgi:hypothetical protein